MRFPRQVGHRRGGGNLVGLVCNLFCVVIKPKTPGVEVAVLNRGHSGRGSERTVMIAMKGSICEASVGSEKRSSSAGRPADRVLA